MLVREPLAPLSLGSSSRQQSLPSVSSTGSSSLSVLSTTLSFQRRSLLRPPEHELLRCVMHTSQAAKNQLQSKSDSALQWAWIILFTDSTPVTQDSLDMSLVEHYNSWCSDAVEHDKSGTYCSSLICDDYSSFTTFLLTKIILTSVAIGTTIRITPSCQYIVEKVLLISIKAL